MRRANKTFRNVFFKRIYKEAKIMIYYCCMHSWMYSEVAINFNFYQQLPGK